MVYFETKSLLKDTVKTPIQSETSLTKYPCTGFCFMVIQNRDEIIQKYKNKHDDKIAYYDLIKNLIIKAGERKRDNSVIDKDGEHIDDPTIIYDFVDIFRYVDPIEDRGVVTVIDLDIFTNDFYGYLLQIKTKDCIIVNRSSETFLILKIEEEKLLIVDSHQDCHGTVDYYDALKYVTKDGVYRGNIQFGVCFF